MWLVKGRFEGQSRFGEQLQNLRNSHSKFFESTIKNQESQTYRSLDRQV